MKNYTLSDLNKTIWYRAIKTIYSLTIISTILILGVIGFDDSPILGLVYPVTIIIVSIILQKSFYYTLFGTINPQK